MLEVVMRGAEVREIVVGSLAAVYPVDCVIELAAFGAAVAARESAGFV